MGFQPYPEKQSPRGLLQFPPFHRLFYSLSLTYLLFSFPALFAEELRKPADWVVAPGFSAWGSASSIRKAASQSPFLMASEGDPGTPGGGVHMLLEKGGFHGENPGKGRVHLSGEWLTEPFYIAAGNRYLPSPFSSFLMDRNGYSGLRDVPHKREEDSLFLRPFPFLWTPGLFFLIDNHHRPGYFFASPDRRLFLAYDPSGGKGAIALQSGDFDAPFSVVSDITIAKRDAEGMAFTGWKSRDGLYSLHLTAERRSQWDKSQGHSSLPPGSRKGKSGLGYIRLGYRSTIFAGGGGMDRGDEGMRLGGMELHAPSPSGFYLGGRVRLYRHCPYGSKLPCRRDAGGALGSGYESGSFHSALFLESRKGGLRSAGLTIDYSGRQSPISVGVGAIWSARELKNGEFLFLPGPMDQTPGIRFLQTGRGMALLRIKSRYLYLSASTSFNREADDLYLSFQAILPFHIIFTGNRQARDRKQEETDRISKLH